MDTPAASTTTHWDIVSRHEESDIGQPSCGRCKMSCKYHTAVLHTKTPDLSTQHLYIKPWTTPPYVIYRRQWSLWSDVGVSSERIHQALLQTGVRHSTCFGFSFPDFRFLWASCISSTGSEPCRLLSSSQSTLTSRIASLHTPTCLQTLTPRFFFSTYTSHKQT